MIGPRPGEDGSDAIVEQLTSEARQVGRDVPSALACASRWQPRLPYPGRGRTRLLWDALARLGAVDLQLARACEPHFDAAAILHELDGRSLPERSTWGVFAAEGPGVRLEARETPAGWRLSGTKPWCSLAAQLSHGLVTAWRGDQRGLFAVQLTHAGVAMGTGPWVPHGLPDVVSTTIHLDDVPAEPVGAAGWYLDRDGFAWGGMGVAAVWYGGTVAVARRLARQALERELDQVGRSHLGAVDRALHAARVVLEHAADDVDAGRAVGPYGALLAHRVRGTVAASAEEVLRRSDHALGPGPLVAEPAHAAAVADLHLYLRQHHAERDDAALGGLVQAQPSW